MTFAESQDQAARVYLRSLLFSCGWNMQKAAELAGLNRSTMYALVERLNIERLHLRRYRRGNQDWKELRA